MSRQNLLLAVVTGLSLLAVTAAANLQVPLYPEYAHNAGAGAGMTAVVFAAYVAGLLPVLIGLGGLSDRVGRLPVVVASLVAGAIATGMVWAVPTLGSLLIARLFQGVSVGFGLVAGTAFLTELLGESLGAARAATVTAATTSMGFGSGALITSGFLLIQPASSPLSYPLGVFFLAVCAVALVVLRGGQPSRPEPANGGSATQGRLFLLPAFPKGSALPIWAIAVAWAASGLVIAIVPTQLAEFGLAAWSGPILFAVNGTGVLVLPLVRRLTWMASLRVGFVLLPVGFGMLVIGAWLGWLPLVLVGAMIAGAAGYGYTYLGGLQRVSELGGVDRARAVSGYFFWAYVGFGVPSIVVGYLADAIGLPLALGLFGGLIVVTSIALMAASYRGAARAA